MKTLAVVTVTFLPGTFVSALFAIPVFDWDAGTNQSIVSSRLWMYWAVTIPLTILTIVPWLLWTRSANRSHRAQLTKTRDEFRKDIRKLGEDVGDEEVEDESIEGTKESREKRAV